MSFKIKNIIIIFLLAISGFFSWKAYLFFLDTKIPNIKLIGIKDDGYYCGNIQCTAFSDKIGKMSVWLDEKSIAKKFQIKSPRQEHPFIIPTRTMTNGKHKIKIEFTDNTYNKNRTEHTHHFYVDNTPLQAAFVKSETEFKVLQGRTLHIQFQVNKKIKEAKIKTLSNTYECFPEFKNSSLYEAFIPIQCEEPSNEYLISVEIKDYVGNILNLENKLQIIKFPFKQQTLNISQKKVKMEKELGEDSDQIENDIKEALMQSPKQKLWRGPFCTPIDIARTTCEFGTIRKTQEKGKYTHKAVDIINTPKSVVWASQDGIVKIKKRYGMHGNTVVIDHGWGIFTIYSHLDNFANISIGGKISKGNPIGTIGKTGYASGYHLHWELRVNNIPVDPMQWVKTTF